MSHHVANNWVADCHRSSRNSLRTYCQGHGLGPKHESAKPIMEQVRIPANCRAWVGTTHYGNDPLAGRTSTRRRERTDAGTESNLVSFRL